MFVLLPYVHGYLREPTLAEVTKQAARYGLPIERLVIDPLDRTAYHRGMADRWAAGEGFIVVEHDVVPPEGAFERFLTCPEMVCANPYTCGAGDAVLALGCTRFSDELLRTLPTIMKEAEDPWHEDFPPMDWRRIDVRVFAALEAHTVRCHEHQPPAEHLHAYP